jgi:CYTH domain-containing protein
VINRRIRYIYPNELQIVEVEFRTSKQESSFICPIWFGKEITEENRYSNIHLAVSDETTKKSV